MTDVDQITAIVTDARVEPTPVPVPRPPAPSPAFDAAFQTARERAATSPDRVAPGSADRLVAGGRLGRTVDSEPATRARIIRDDMLVAAGTEPVRRRVTTLGDQLASVASEYAGLRATAGGSSPEVGFGSAAFVRHAMSRMGVSVPDGAPISGIGSPVASLADARPGDLITTSAGAPAVYVGDGDIAIADTLRGEIRITALDAPPAHIRRVFSTDAAALTSGDTLEAGDVVDIDLVPGLDAGSLEGVPFADLFLKEGESHGVDPRLLAAVAWQESRYKPTAVSHAGAQGLMQIMPATARGLGVADSFDPAQAVDGAARLLASHLRKYDGDLRLALAAYNAGGGAVDRYGGVPPYKETQHYVVAVQEKYEELQR